MLLELLGDLTVIAAEGVPADAPSARLSVPLGILAFFGSIYLLLRSNLGTRRAYLVLATSFFGFMFILSLFWTFGAPGTPEAVGPTYLPTQQSDNYEPGWTPFAQDSLVAEREEYAIVQDHPSGFGSVPSEFESEAEEGADDIASFFATDDAGGVVEEDWEIEAIDYAEADTGQPVIAVTYLETAEGEVVDGGEEATLFAFFDEGAPLFPGFVFVFLSVLGFALHAFMLSRDEARERREVAEDLAQEDERVPAGV
jgi:hypothetical protein